MLTNKYSSLNNNLKQALADFTNASVFETTRRFGSLQNSFRYQVSWTTYCNLPKFCVVSKSVTWWYSPLKNIRPKIRSWIRLENRSIKTYYTHSNKYLDILHSWILDILSNFLTHSRIKWDRLCNEPLTSWSLLIGLHLNYIQGVSKISFPSRGT